MQCPNDGAVLEREDHCDEVINALYWCLDCDFLAIWRQFVWGKRPRRGFRGHWEVLFPGIGREEDSS